jgi:hypothetical protein
MAELGTVYVDVKGDFDQFGKQSQSSFGAIGKAAAGVFAAAFVGKQIFDFGAQSVEQASLVTESTNAVNQSFDAINAAAIQKIGETSAESFGLSESAFNSLAVQLSGFSTQIAGVGGDTAGVTEELATRIADFASIHNLELSDAATKFGSALAGETEAMRRFGIDVSAAAVEQYALANGIGDGSGELTEQEKVLARHGLLMQSTNQWAGDFANTSGDLANSTRIAKADFENLQAELGSALLPVLGEVMGVVRDALIPALASLTPVFVQVAEIIAQLLPPVAGLLEQLAPLAAKILPVLAKILGVIIELFLALAEPIIVLLDAILTPLLPIIEMLAVEFGEALMPAIQAVAEIVQALLPLLDLLMPLIEVIAEVAGMLAEVLGGLLAGAIGVVADLIEILIDWITPAIEFVTDFASSIRDNLAESLEGVVTWFQELPGKILDFVRDAVTWLVDTGKNLIQGFIDGIKSMASKVLKAITDFVLDKIPGFVKDFFGIGSPSKMFMEFGAALTEGLAMGITGGAGDVNRAINGLLREPSMPGFGGLGVGAGGGLTQVFNAPVAGDMGLFAEQMARANARELRYVRG